MLARGLTSLVVLAAMASVMISFATASPLESEEEISTTPATQNTYFGVDANDKDAVAEKQRELSHEKWRELMGDVDIEGVNFSPEISNPLDFLKSIFSRQASSEQVEAFSKTIKSLAEKVSKTLSEGRHADEIRKIANELLKVVSKIGEQPAIQAAFKKIQELLPKKE